MVLLVTRGPPPRLASGAERQAVLTEGADKCDSATTAWPLGAEVALPTTFPRWLWHSTPATRPPQRGLSWGQGGRGGSRVRD